MNRKKSFEISEELLNKIVSVAYGDASLIDKIKIRKLAKIQPVVSSLLEEYKKTAKSVHSIKMDECPSEIVNSSKEIGNISTESKSSIFLDFYTAVFSKPIVSAATVIILTIAIITSVFIDRSGTYGGYTLEEIERANRQTRQALAIVSGIFSKTQNSLTNDIIISKVSKPINEGMNTVNKLFSEKENQNEN